MILCNVRCAAFALVWLAGCGGSLKGGGGSGQLDKPGSAGSGAGGGAGGAPACPRAPATNDPECHPEDTGLWAAGFPVPALDGDCTPGLTCEIPVGVNNDCAQALGLQTFVCCPANFSGATAVSVPPLPSGFVPGATMDACLKPIPGQDPACALPLPSTCAVDGLVCSYRSEFGAGSDAGCFACGNRDYTIRCCGGVWAPGDSCPGDGGMD